MDHFKILVFVVLALTITYAKEETIPCTDTACKKCPTESCAGACKGKNGVEKKCNPNFSNPAKTTCTCAVPEANQKFIPCTDATCTKCPTIQNCNAACKAIQDKVFVYEQKECVAFSSDKTKPICVCQQATPDRKKPLKPYQGPIMCRPPVTDCSKGCPDANGKTTSCQLACETYNMKRKSCVPPKNDDKKDPRMICDCEENKV